jgi:hypothetical protein
MTSSIQSCSDAQERFDIHELGLAPLETEAKRQMEQHFKTCEPCQKWLSQWELVKLEAHSLEQLEVPAMILPSIMSKIEAAPPLVPHVQSATISTTSSTSQTPLFQSDLLVAAAAFVLLLAASLQYASESFEGTASWCFSFAVLFAVQYFLKGKTSEPQFKT